MQELFWLWQCSDRYIISLFPHLHTSSPFSPSLISLMVFVDVKHNVYLIPALSEFRSCVKVGVDALGSPFLISLLVSVDVKQHWNEANSRTTLSNFSVNTFHNANWRILKDTEEKRSPVRSVPSIWNRKSIDSLGWVMQQIGGRWGGDPASAKQLVYFANCCFNSCAEQRQKDGVRKSDCWGANLQQLDKPPGLWEPSSTFLLLCK